MERNCGRLATGHGLPPLFGRAGKWWKRLRTLIESNCSAAANIQSNFDNTIWPTERSPMNRSSWNSCVEASSCRKSAEQGRAVPGVHSCQWCVAKISRRSSQSSWLLVPENEEHTPLVSVQDRQGCVAERSVVHLAGTEIRCFLS